MGIHNRESKLRIYSFEGPIVLDRNINSNTFVTQMDSVIYASRVWENTCGSRSNWGACQTVLSKLKFHQSWVVASFACHRHGQKSDGLRNWMRNYHRCGPCIVSSGLMVTKSAVVLPNDSWESTKRNGIFPVDLCICAFCREVSTCKFCSQSVWCTHAYYQRWATMVQIGLALDCSFLNDKSLS